MFVKPSTILPSQDFLKPDTLEYIFECIKNGNFDRLPPTPIVRRDASGNLVAIDGHNLIAVRLFLKEDVEVLIAESASPLLPPINEANKMRNNELSANFDKVLEDRKNTIMAGIRDFQDLIDKYPQLFEP